MEVGGLEFFSNSLSWLAVIVGLVSLISGFLAGSFASKKVREADAAIDKVNKQQERLGRYKQAYPTGSKSNTYEKVLYNDTELSELVDKILKRGDAARSHS